MRTKYKLGKHRNKQQLTKTDKTQKFTNTHEQHELPMNQEWTQVLRNRKLFMPIAIHPPFKGLVHGQVPYESNPVMGGGGGGGGEIIYNFRSFAIWVTDTVTRGVRYPDGKWSEVVVDSFPPITGFDSYGTMCQLMI
jgi:hypothetical protein